MTKIFLALLLCTSFLSAHNNLFFPGDCYFSTTIDKTFAVSENKTLKLEYHRLKKSIMKCGYAGCSNLKLLEISPSLHNNLKIVHKRLFEKELQFSKAVRKYDESNTMKEFSSFTLFIYNKSFDFKNRLLGLRYNEHWSTEQIVGAKKRHAIYEGSDNKALLIEDYANSIQVKPLKLTKPPKSLEGSMGVQTPVEGKASDYQYIIPLTQDVWKSLTDEQGFNFLVIDEKQITEYTYLKGKVTKATHK